jgi:hypothetical protein
VSRGEHRRSFYHPIFKRGNWEGVKQMMRYLQPKRGQENSSTSNGSNIAASSSSGSREVGYGAAQSSIDTAAAYHPLSTMPQGAPRSYPGLYAQSGYQIPTPALAPAPAPLLLPQAPFVPHFSGIPVEFTATGAYISLQPQGGGLFIVTTADGTPLFTVASGPNPAQPSQPSQPTASTLAMSATMMVMGINPPFQSSAHLGMDMGIGMDMDMGMGNMGMGNGIAPSKQDDTNLGPVARILIDTLDDYDEDIFAEEFDAVTQLKLGKGHRAGQHLIPLSDVKVNPITGAVKVDLGNSIETDHHFAIDYMDLESSELSELSPKWVIIPLDYSIPLLFKDGSMAAVSAPPAPIGLPNQPPSDGNRKADTPHLSAPTLGVSEEKASTATTGTRNPLRPRSSSLDDVYAVCDYLMEIT